MSNDYISTGSDYSVTFETKSSTSMESYPEHKYDFSNLIVDVSNTISVTSTTFDASYTVTLDCFSCCQFNGFLNFFNSIFWIGMRTFKFG